MVCQRCEIGSLELLYQNVKDYEHSTVSSSDFFKCKCCGHLIQNPKPSCEELRLAYPPDYRPHLIATKKNSREALFVAFKDLQARLLLNKFRKILPEKEEPILELGCGAGRLLFTLKRYGFKDLTGVDQNLALKTPLENEAISFHQADLGTSLTLSRKYKLIFLSYVLEHVYEPETLLKKCRELLMPGGHLILVTPNTLSLSHSIFKRFWADLHAPRHLEVFSPTSFKKTASRAGFSSVTLSYPLDPGTWAVSFQNWMEAGTFSEHPLPGGTRWYTLLLLPFWILPAIIEKILGKGSTLLASLSV